MAAALLAVGLLVAPAPAPATTLRGDADGPPWDPVFARPLQLDTCLHHLLRRCYGPAPLRRAYGLDRLHARGIDGRGTTIAIIVNSVARLRASLALQSRAYGLPPARLVVRHPAGDPGAPGTGTEALEGTLDVEAAHLAAPRARLLYLAVPVSSFDGVVLEDGPLAQAVDAAIRARADVISMSFGGVERPYPALRAALRRAARAGVPAVASSGDWGVVMPGLSGAQAVYPAADPHVTAVGGTLVTLDAAGRRLMRDVAWGPDARVGASGGGVSRVSPRPSWQTGLRGTHAGGRNYPDLSLLGAPSSGMVVAFDHLRPEQPAEFRPLAGTSVSAPLLAGTVALARQVAGRPLHSLNGAIYRLARTPRRTGIVDVLLGNNSYGDAADGSGQGTKVPGYLAHRGYDLVTGLGTIDAARFVPALARAAAG